MSGKYDDIIHLTRPVSGTRAKMSATDRAAQFSPFAALTGYEDAIQETGRRTDHRAEISDSRNAELNARLLELLDALEECPKVKITRFLADARKEGGAYVTGVHRIRKIDPYRRELWTTEGERIPMDDIWELELIDK